MQGVALSEAKFAEELAREPEEPFLPVEKKLIAWSIGLGIVLMGVFILASYLLFKG